VTFIFFVGPHSRTGERQTCAKTSTEERHEGSGSTEAEDDPRRSGRRRLGRFAGKPR